MASLDTASLPEELAKAAALRQRFTACCTEIADAGSTAEAVSCAMDRYLAETLGFELPAAAQVIWHDRIVRPLKADAHVSVNNVAGRIEVEAWDKNELQITGELGEDVEKLEITGTESSLKVEVKLPRDGHNIDGDTVLLLKLPAGASLEAEAVSADVSVRGLLGQAS